MTADDYISAVCSNFAICSEGCPYKVDGKYTCNDIDDYDYIISVYNSYFGIEDNTIILSDSDIDSILND